MLTAPFFIIILKTMILFFFNPFPLFLILLMQYGFVNSALEKLIKRRFGVEKWEEIR